MPKRQNPFGESSPLQVKTHIGTKEVDMGVNSEKNMASVYERTKSLLFEGAKKMSPVKCMDRTEERLLLKPLAGQCRLSFKSQSNVDSACAGAMEVSLERPSHCSMSQDLPMVVDMNGNKTPAAAINMDTSISVMPKGQMQIDSTGHLQVAKVQCSTVVTPFKLCNSCLRPSPHGMEACQFCDKLTCVNCIRQCHACHGFFCQVCSIINYDACLERPFCLQCSS